MVDDHRWYATPNAQRGRLVSRNAWLVPCFLGVDYVLFAGVCVLWFLLEYTDYLPEATERGFWCDERQYMKPYIEDKVVSEKGLYVVSFTVPVILMLIGESMLALCKCDNDREYFKLVKSCSIKLYTPMRRVLRFIGVFGFGGFATWIVTDFIQILTGRMTPYFFAACDPDACSPIYGVPDSRFVTDYTCLSDDQEFIKQARRSLPSLHASLGSYSAIFVTVYLSSQMRFRSVRLPVPLICLSYTSCAVVWGLCRASSYRHHWTDVLAGFVLGTSIALYLSVVILKFFRENHSRPPSNIAESPSRSSIMLSGDEEHFMRTAPSSFVLPRVQHCRGADSSSTSHMSQQNGATGNPAYLDDIMIVHHQAQPGTI